MKLDSILNLFLILALKNIQVLHHQNIGKRIHLKQTRSSCLKMTNFVKSTQAKLNLNFFTKNSKISAFCPFSNICLQCQIELRDNYFSLNYSLIIFLVTTSLSVQILKTYTPLGRFDKLIASLFVLHCIFE